MDFLVDTFPSSLAPPHNPLAISLFVFRPFHLFTVQSIVIARCSLFRFNS